MQKLHFSITINASREKVWDTVIGEKTYPQWTQAFSPGSSASYARGDWSVGSKMLFIAPNADGKNEGMVSTIAESKRPDFYRSNTLDLSRTVLKIRKALK